MPKRVVERREVMSFSLDPNVADLLRKYAEATNQTMSAIVEQILRDFLKDN